MATGLLLDRGIGPLDGGIPATRLSASGSSGARAGSQGGDFGRGEGLADSAAGLILLLAIVEVGTAKFEAPVAQKNELSTCKYIMNCMAWIIWLPTGNNAESRVYRGHLAASLRIICLRQPINQYQ